MCFWGFSLALARAAKEKYTSNSFQIEWDMIVVIVFISILAQIEFHLVQNQKKTVTTIKSH